MQAFLCSSTCVGETICSIGSPPSPRLWRLFLNNSVLFEPFVYFFLKYGMVWAVLLDRCLQDDMLRNIFLACCFGGVCSLFVHLEECSCSYTNPKEK